MATTNRVYILVAFVFSAIGAIFNMVSLGTEEWVTAKAILVNNSSNDVSQVNYGLFQGSYVRNLASVNVFDLQMTCNFQNNICAVLCGEDRYSLLSDLYYNNFDGSDAMDNCYKAYKSAYSYNYGVQGEKKIGARSNKSVQYESFINAGVWLCTVIFLILSALIGAIAAILALYNTVSNPIQYYLGVKSLYVYNLVPFCCTVLYMVLWGTMYNIRIFHNVAIYDTITGNLSSDKRAYLGYSYWISFVPLVFYTGTIGILFYREYLNEKDPKQQKVDLDADSADPNLYLY